jgi:hypothetical protein
MEKPHHDGTNEISKSAKCRKRLAVQDCTGIGKWDDSDDYD